MSDLIERQSVRALYRKYQPYMAVSVIEFGKELEKLPSAEPVRITGKWKQISPAKIYECSECGQNVMTNDITCYRYCHGCGVKMEVEG